MVRLVCTLLALYPRAWRQRYAAEVAEVTRELLANGERGPLRLGLGLAGSALIERVRFLTRSQRALLVVAPAVMIAALVAIATLAVGAPQQLPSQFVVTACHVEAGVRAGSITRELASVVPLVRVGLAGSADQARRDGPSVLGGRILGSRQHLVLVCQAA